MSKFNKFLIMAMFLWLHCLFCVADQFGDGEKYFVIPAILPVHMTNGMSVFIDGSNGLEMAVRGVLKELSVDHVDDISQLNKNDDIRKVYVMGSDDYAGKSFLGTLSFTVTMDLVPVTHVFEQIAMMYGMHLLTNDRTISFCRLQEVPMHNLYVITGEVWYDNIDKQVTSLSVKPRRGIELLYVNLQADKYICVVKCERYESRIFYGNQLLTLDVTKEPWQKLIFVFDDSIEIELPYTNLDRNKVNVWNVKLDAE